jgi:transketolase
MRNTFAREITAIATERSDIVLLSGDIGNRLFDDFKVVAPGRFLNCGVAEANMMSVAAGMALSGLRPIVYTITPFTTVRVLEQLRVGVCYHGAPVLIVGTGSGLSYAELGPTHHSLEDMAITRCLPDLVVAAPADSEELVAQLHQALTFPGPTYMRIGKRGEPLLGSPGDPARIGSARSLRSGNDVAILCVGPIASEAVVAADSMGASGPSVEVASLGSVKPLDTRFLEELAGRCDRWITLEEHGIVGGLGSAILEWRATSGCDVQVERLAVPDAFIHEIGDQAYTRKFVGIDAESVRLAIQRVLL